jgi:hypothetical protein
MKQEEIGRKEMTLNKLINYYRREVERREIILKTCDGDMNLFYLIVRGESYDDFLKELDIYKWTIFYLESWIGRREGSSS